ncbi:MAG: membrane-bound lytic murein transglycosylase MltF [Gammaproteobacteria bacterium]|nr:membrane-bound lytic murein transglycosylase MltF [Gammaproteobacteria bacterium]
MPRTPSLAVLLLSVLLAACGQRTQLDAIVEAGELRVALRQLPPDLQAEYAGPAGFDYAIAREFADRLGVAMRPVLTPDVDELRLVLEGGEGHLGAVPIPITRNHARELNFSRPFLRADPVLVYRYGDGRPSSLDALTGPVYVAHGSGHAEQLAPLESAHPGLEWHVDYRADTWELLRQVADGELAYTVAYTHQVDIAQRLYPELRTAFRVGEARDFAWVLPSYADDTLVLALHEFFDELESSGRLQTLIDQYYGHFGDFDYVEMRAFQRRVETRLPAYEPLFKAAAGDDIDWRLLAAISYQESHWDPEARSPTGVRGLMMLTRDTAEQLGITDRTDPAQSIVGGADYLRWVRDKIPERIPEPDRTWLALATYNIGFGHLEDARRLTQRGGGDPDRWNDVRNHLPLLARKKYYETVRHGYARGGEAVAYVENIRTFYDLLSRRLQLEAAAERADLIGVPTLTPLAF